MIKKIDKIIARISGGIGSVTYVAFVGIMFTISVDVIMRKVFQFSIPGSYEIVERMLLLLVFAAFAYGQTNRAHIHVTLFIKLFPKLIRMALFGVLGLLSTATAIFCGYAVWLQGDYSLRAKTVTAVLYIPLYPFFYIASVCMYAFALTLLWDAIKSFIGVVNDEVAKDLQSTWD